MKTAEYGESPVVDGSQGRPGRPVEDVFGLSKPQTYSASAHTSGYDSGKDGGRVSSRQLLVHEQVLHNLWEQDVVRPKQRE